MTRTAPVASPVDFATYGDYGDYLAKKRAATDGTFVRPVYPFQGRITADGSSGFPAEAGRYHLYASLACPWAHRSVIVRKLIGLEEVVSLSVVDPVRDGRGWAFRDGPGYGPDPVNGFTLLREAYEATEPGYDGHISVPVLWDRETSRIVSNNFPDITIDLGTQFGAWAAPGLDLYPRPLRAEIDALNDQVYLSVNNGVYQCGFAGTQQAYDVAVAALFATLDELEERLSGRRYLVGNQITEADWRLFPTLVRFDVAYFSLFKCNRKRIADYPNLSNYMRELYRVPGVADTVKPRYYVINYYSIAKVNPTGIIPKGTPVDFGQPHNRARLVA